MIDTMFKFKFRLDYPLDYFNLYRGGSIIDVSLSTCLFRFISKILTTNV